MENHRKAYLYAGITILFWSTVATAFKIGLGEMNFSVLLFWSILTSLAVFIIVAIVQGEVSGLFRHAPSDYLRSAFLGFINPFVYYLILFKAYSLLPAQVAQPLNMIWPVVLVFLSVPLLKQSIPSRSYIALFICFAGVFFISSRGNISGFDLQDPLGILLALSSSVLWSLYWIFNIKDKRDEVNKLFLNFLFAAIYILLFVLFNHEGKIPSLKGLMAGVYIGIFEMGLSFFFWLKALRYARSPDQISILMYLFPFISLIFIHFIVGEKIYYTTFIGLLFIVLGIFIQKFDFRKKTLR